MNRKGIKIFKLDVEINPEKELKKELVKKVEGKIKVPKPKNDNWQTTDKIDHGSKKNPPKWTK